jgi:hypothetical protein
VLNHVIDYSMALEELKTETLAGKDIDANMFAKSRSLLAVHECPSVARSVNSEGTFLKGVIVGTENARTDEATSCWTLTDASCQFPKFKPCDEWRTCRTLILHFRKWSATTSKVCSGRCQSTLRTALVRQQSAARMC